jgi:superfamily II RNA helicase
MGQPLSSFLPAEPGQTDPLGAASPLERFLAWSEARGIELYPAQEEAVLEVMTGSHVIVSTPTGSGHRGRRGQP